MDNLEQLSDDELRRRLLQFGFPNLPVTSTTRKLLIKKLRNHMDTERSKLRRQTVHATRYSSDEDLSDRASSSSTGSGRRSSGQKWRGRTAEAAAAASSRATIASPSANVSFTRPTYRPNAPVSTPPSLALRPPTRTSPSVYVSPMLHSSSGDDDDADDSNDEREHNASMTNGGHAQPLLGASTSESPYISEFTQRLLNLRGKTVDSLDSPTQSHINATPTAYKRPSSYTYAGSRLAQTHTPHYPLSNNNNHYSDASFNASVDGSTTNGSYRSQAIRSRPPISSSSSMFAAARRRLVNLWPYGSSASKNSSIVPFVLRSLLLAFFLLVAIAYLAIKPNLANTIRASDTTFAFCDADRHHPAHLPCIADTQALDEALGMIRRTADELQRRAVEQRCGDRTVRSVMDSHEIVRNAMTAPTDGGQFSMEHLMRTLADAVYLLHTNPQWGIQQCDATGDRRVDWTPDDGNAVQYFHIPHPTLSLRCRLSNKLKTFYVLVLSIGLLALVAYASFALVAFVQRWRQARKDTVDHLIADIIQALMERAAAVAGSDQPDDALVVISHLRDELLPASQRVSQGWAWDEAVRFLEANESRIHFDIGKHLGEDCRMMRWSAETAAGGSPRAPRYASGGHGTSTPIAGKPAAPVKKWQSPAFDKVNTIRSPPTPCLKIRHMFEANEANSPALRLVIQDAVLEKVQNTGCRVFDMQVDAYSCCVYVRCATLADAGIVYEQINGWWFDSRLVSVKFLHLERYLARFPNALNGPKCMQPSNNRMLSMGGGSPAHCSDGADEY